MILAKWYKQTIQNGLLDAVYTNKKKTAGINLNDPTVKEQIYQRYLQAYKKGAFNFIKEDPAPNGQIVPRKYFSGGTSLAMTVKNDGTRAMVSTNEAISFIARLFTTAGFRVLKLKALTEKEQRQEDKWREERQALQKREDQEREAQLRRLILSNRSIVESLIINRGPRVDPIAIKIYDAMAEEINRKVHSNPEYREGSGVWFWVVYQALKYILDGRDYEIYLKREKPPQFVPFHDYNRPYTPKDYIEILPKATTPKSTQSPAMISDPVVVPEIFNYVRDLKSSSWIELRELLDEYFRNNLKNDVETRNDIQYSLNIFRTLLSPELCALILRKEQEHAGNTSSLLSSLFGNGINRLLVDILKKLDSQPEAVSQMVKMSKEFIMIPSTKPDSQILESVKNYFYHISYLAERKESSVFNSLVNDQQVQDYIYERTTQEHWQPYLWNLNILLEAMLDPGLNNQWNSKVSGWIPGIIELMKRFHVPMISSMNSAEYWDSTGLFSRLMALDLMKFNDRDLFKAFIELGNGQGDIIARLSFVTVQMMAEKLQKAGAIPPYETYAEVRTELIPEGLGRPDLLEAKPEVNVLYQHFRTKVDEIQAPLRLANAQSHLSQQEVSTLIALIHEIEAKEGFRLSALIPVIFQLPIGSPIYHAAIQIRIEFRGRLRAINVDDLADRYHLNTGGLSEKELLSSWIRTDAAMIFTGQAEIVPVGETGSSTWGKMLSNETRPRESRTVSMSLYKFEKGYVALLHGQRSTQSAHVFLHDKDRRLAMKIFDRIALALEEREKPETAITDEQIQQRAQSVIVQMNKNGEIPDGIMPGLVDSMMGLSENEQWKRLALDARYWLEENQKIRDNILPDFGSRGLGETSGLVADMEKLRMENSSNPRVKLFDLYRRAAGVRATSLALDFNGKPLTIENYTPMDIYPTLDRWIKEITEDKAALEKVRLLIEPGETSGFNATHSFNEQRLRKQIFAIEEALGSPADARHKKADEVIAWIKKDPVNNFKNEEVFVLDGAAFIGRVDQKVAEKLGYKWQDINLAMLSSATQNPAMNTSKAPATKVSRGGIDLNQINPQRTGKTIKVQFDPAQLSAFQAGGFEGFRPEITDFQFIQSPLPLLGIVPKRQEELAKG